MTNTNRATKHSVKPSVLIRKSVLQNLTIGLAIMFILLIISSFALIGKSKTIKDLSQKEPDIRYETVVIETTVEVPITKTYIIKDLGKFKLTAYCSCEHCCGIWACNRPVDKEGNQIVTTKSGNRAIQGRTISTDERIIPMGTNVVIACDKLGTTDINTIAQNINSQENLPIYQSMDTGSKIKGNVIDVYFDNHADAEAFGVQYAEVYQIIEIDN